MIFNTRRHQKPTTDLSKTVFVWDQKPTCIFIRFSLILVRFWHPKSIRKSSKTGAGHLAERSWNGSGPEIAPQPDFLRFGTRNVNFWTSKYRCWEPRPDVFDPHNLRFCQTETQNKTNQHTQTNKQTIKQTIKQSINQSRNPHEQVWPTFGWWTTPSPQTKK